MKTSIYLPKMVRLLDVEQIGPREKLFTLELPDGRSLEHESGQFAMISVLGVGIPETQIYLSLERRMKCGVGKCGHCQINSLYCCQDGPVFAYARIKGLEGAL